MTFLHWVLLAFFSYAILALAWTHDWYDGGWGLWTFAILALAFTFGSAGMSLRKVLIGIALGLSFSSLVAILQSLVLPTAATLYPTCNWDAVGVATLCWKVAGIYHNPMIAGTLSALMLVALLNERLWWLALGVAPGFLLSGSRGALVALAMGINVILFRSLYGTLILGLFFVIGFGLWLGPTDWDRFAIWDIARQGLTLSGYGPGSFQGVATATSHPEHVHNDYLQLVFEYGIGSALLLGVWLTLLTRTNAHTWPVFLTFSLLALFSFPLYTPMLAFLGALSAGSIAREWDLASNHGHRRRSRLQPWPTPWTVRFGGVRSPTVPLEQRLSN